MDHGDPYHLDAPLPDLPPCQHTQRDRVYMEGSGHYVCRCGLQDPVDPRYDCLPIDAAGSLPDASQCSHETVWLLSAKMAECSACGVLLPPPMTATVLVRLAAPPTDSLRAAAMFVMAMDGDLHATEDSWANPPRQYSICAFESLVLKSLQDGCTGGGMLVLYDEKEKTLVVRLILKE